jgi:ubiquinone/menaquinone biosynthesis C-methylase UbiE
VRHGSQTLLSPIIVRLRTTGNRLLRGNRRHLSDDADERWFWDHFDMASRQIEDFLGAAGVPLGGKAVADIGCGDGIMALGVAHRSRPGRLVGFDISAVDQEMLIERARRYGVARSLPDVLSFRRSQPTSLPAENNSFDVAYTWSAFEHVADPAALFNEIRRVLKPSGVMMLQLWPFYYSASGSHLWDWFPEPFHHLTRPHDELVEVMRASDRTSDDMTEYMIKEFTRLNRITLDELQRCVLSAGLEIRKVELMGEAVHLPPGVSRYPLSQLAVSGVKLLATVERSRDAVD